MWNSNGFLGVYADFLEKAEPPKEDKLETLKQLRIQRYEERQRVKTTLNPSALKRNAPGDI